MRQMTTPERFLVVMIGWDHFAASVAGELLSAFTQNSSMLIVVASEEIASSIECRGHKAVDVVVTSYTDFETIEERGARDASAVVVNMADDREKLIYVVNWRKVFPNARLIVPIDNTSLTKTFITAAEVLPLSRDEVSAKIFASYLFEFDVATYLFDLLTPAQADDDYDIQQHLLPAGNGFCGMAYSDVFVALKKQYNAILIGVSSIGPDGEYQLSKNPADNRLIESNDYLILILSGGSSNRLNEALQASIG